MYRLTKWTQFLFVSGVGLQGCVTVCMCHVTDSRSVCECVCADERPFRGDTVYVQSSIDFSRSESTGHRSVLSS